MKIQIKYYQLYFQLNEWIQPRDSVYHDELPQRTRGQNIKIERQYCGRFLRRKMHEIFILFNTENRKFTYGQEPPNKENCLVSTYTRSGNIYFNSNTWETIYSYHLYFNYCR